SIILLWWLFHAALNVSLDFILWPKSTWAYWVPNITMPFVFIILTMGISTPNALSILCKQSPFNADKPLGIVAITRHPILWAMFLWAASHIFPNGSLSLVIVFSICMLFSLFGMKLIDLRMQKSLGKDVWKELSRNTSIIPFGALTKSTIWSIFTRDDLYRVIIGLILYYASLHFHQYILGVNPVHLING
ncbi:MAG: hypothetical protein KBC27_03930, partial [Rickettsiales bacterium]|nr:hypothetical protein [Rickettsiales bacterium]